MDNKDKEALSILQEEAAEVIQAISKCFRFGLYAVKPGQEISNQEHLEEEIGDLLALIDFLKDKGTISTGCIEAAKLAKKEKLKTWSNLYK